MTLIDLVAWVHTRQFADVLALAQQLYNLHPKNDLSVLCTSCICIFSAATVCDPSWHTVEIHSLRLPDRIRLSFALVEALFCSFAPACRLEHACYCQPYALRSEAHKPATFRLGISLVWWSLAGRSKVDSNSRHVHACAGRAYAPRSPSPKNPKPRQHDPDSWIPDFRRRPQGPGLQQIRRVETIRPRSAALPLASQLLTSPSFSPSALSTSWPARP